MAPQEGVEELSFEFRKQRFCWEAADGHFAKLKYPTHVRNLPAAAPLLSATAVFLVWGSKYREVPKH